MQWQALTQQWFLGRRGRWRGGSGIPLKIRWQNTHNVHTVRRVADLAQYIQRLLLLGTWPVLNILCQLFNLQSYPMRRIPLLLPFPLREIETQATVRSLPQALQWVESDTRPEYAGLVRLAPVGPLWTKGRASLCKLDQTVPDTLLLPAGKCLSTVIIKTWTALSLAVRCLAILSRRKARAAEYGGCGMLSEMWTQPRRYC